MLLKRGTDTGKVDSKGQAILAGDKVIKIGYNQVYIVNKYGGLSDESGTPLIAAKQWRGMDYTVKIDVDSPDEDEEQKAVEAVNEVRAEEMKQTDKDKLIADLRKQLKETENKLEQKYEELGQACDCVSDMQKEMEDLKDELKTKHTILEDMQKTIDSLNSAALRLQEERDAACKAQVDAEGKPLRAYTSSELLVEVRSRGRELQEFLNDDELLDEMRERGFVGSITKVETVVRRTEYTL